MPDVIAEIEKRLPDTGRGRYETAYARGRSQARSALLLGGLGLGTAVGAAAMYLLDPARGLARRARLARQLSRIVDEAERRIAETRAARISGELGEEPAVESEHPSAPPPASAAPSVRSVRVEARSAVSARPEPAIEITDEEVDDPFLVERVRAELRAVLSRPEAVTVAAMRDGVILRGEIPVGEVFEALERARRVAGVERVEDRTRHEPQEVGAGR